MLTSRVPEIYEEGVVASAAFAFDAFGNLFPLWPELSDDTVVDVEAVTGDYSLKIAPVSNSFFTVLSGDITPIFT